jgi:hypothetical protein
VATDEAEAELVRQATADLPDTDRLVARVTHLRAIVAWADLVQQTLGALPAAPDPVRTRFEAALTLAHHVLADRDDPDKGDKVLSLVDPDARCGKQEASCDGYLLDSSLDADSELLTALNVLPGNGDETRDAPTLLAAEQQAQGNTIEALSIDGVGWHGEVLQTLRAPGGGGVTVYVPPPPPRRDALVRPGGVCPRCCTQCRDLSRRAPDGDQGPQGPQQRLAVCVCSAPLCGVSLASPVPANAAPAERTERHQE